MKRKIVLLLLISIVLTIVGCSNSEKASDGIDDNYSEVFDNVFSDNVLVSNICDAMLEIGISPKEVSSISKIEDWVAGERYNFVYKDLGLTIYTNMNSTVNSIRLGVDTKIYLEGYESYNINDYIIDTDTQFDLQNDAIEKVKARLRYPSSSDFNILDWVYGRDHDLYSVSSSVQAENAFGVESEVAFTLKYLKENNTFRLVYFSLNGEVITDNVSSLNIPERKQSQTQSVNSEFTNGDEIKLIYGQLGDYGKEITLDGDAYINYHIPEGTYTIKNNVKWCTVYIAKDEYYKNSEGYMENEVVNTIVLDSDNSTAEISIYEGEHIELTINGAVTLTPQ